MTKEILKLSFAVLLVLAGRGASLAKINIVATTEDLAAIAKEVGGEKVDVVWLAKGYQDPHFVDAKPSFLIKLQRADLFIEVGRDLEVGWVPSLLNSARNPKILSGAPGFLDASAPIPILEIPTRQVSRAEGDVHPFGNPHYWLDPENGKLIAKEIENKLSQIDPGNAATFASRSEDFRKRLAAAMEKWEKKAAGIGLAGTKVVTYHRSWSYFAKRFGMEVAGFVEPKPGIPPSPQHIQNLISQIKSQGIKLIIVEPYFDIKLPQKIAHETGAKLVILPPSVGADREIRDYFGLFQRQIDLLSDAIGKEASR
jgi:zinc/manganese transport system substrate-binding protein